MWVKKRETEKVNISMDLRLHVVIDGYADVLTLEPNDKRLNRPVFHTR